MEVTDEFLPDVYRTIIGIEIVATVREAQSPLVHKDRVLAADLVVLSHAEGEERGCAHPLNVSGRLHNAPTVRNGVDHVKVAFQVGKSLFVQRNAVHSAIKEIPDLLFVAPLFRIGDAGRRLTDAAD